MCNKESLFYILTPVYNVEKYIHNCIRSVLNQTYQKFQLIMVDDGSSDKSGYICDDYAKKDSRIHVIHQENRGQLVARQEAARYVLRQSDLDNAYIVYLDSDDLLKPIALETILSVFQTKKCEMVVYELDKMYDGKIIECTRKDKIYSGTITDKNELYRLLFIHGGYNSLCRKAISASLLTDRIYGDVSYVHRGGDLLQSLSFIEKCNKAVFIKDILYTYIIHPNSVSRQSSYETFKIDSTVQRIVLDFLKEQNLWNEQDYEEYFYHLRNCMRDDVGSIARLHTTIKNKILLFDRMKSDEYYSMVLASATYKDRWLSLLKNNRYKKLCREVLIRSRFGSLYRKLQKGK